VVADEDRRIDVVVNASHHAQSPRPRANDADIGRKLLDQQVLAVAVRIGHHDLGCAAGPGAVDGGQGLARHELTVAGILEASRPELIARHRADDALHVDGDVDLEFARLRVAGRRAPGCGTDTRNDERRQDES
jgi:hypothetical protein